MARPFAASEKPHIYRVGTSLGDAFVVAHDEASAKVTASEFVSVPARDVAVVVSISPEQRVDLAWLSARLRVPANRGTTLGQWAKALGIPVRKGEPQVAAPEAPKRNGATAGFSLWEMPSAEASERFGLRREWRRTAASLVPAPSWAATVALFGADSAPGTAWEVREGERLVVQFWTRAGFPKNVLSTVSSQALPWTPPTPREVAQMAREEASMRAGYARGARKRNSGLGWGGGGKGVGRSPDDTVRFRLVLSAGDDALLLRTMEEEGLVRGRPFGLLMLGDDALIDAVMQQAVDAVLAGEGSVGVPWGDVVFDDGSAINDPGMTRVTVHGVSTRPGGLFGTEHAFDVTVHFPPEARYMPAKENGAKRNASSSKPGTATRYYVWAAGHYVGGHAHHLLETAKDDAAARLDVYTKDRQARIDRIVWDTTRDPWKPLRTDKGVAVVRRSDADFARRVARYQKGTSPAEFAAMQAAIRPEDYRPAR